MDAAERLIALAALAEPDRAVAAWRDWRAMQSPADAPHMMVWAAGYIHRKLVAAGAADPYLAGIYRHNLVRNGMLISGGLRTLWEISAAWPITPLKSFGMGGDVYSRGLRPIADIDFYVPQQHVLAVKRLLESRGFAAKESIPAWEFEGRVLPQRGSWNFTNPQRVDLDLHWKMFDHLGAEENEALVQANSTAGETEFGPVRRLTNELLLINLAVHTSLEERTLSYGLFDFYHLLATADVARVIELAVRIGVAREVLALCDVVMELIGDTAHHRLRLLWEDIRCAAVAQVPPDATHSIAPGQEPTAAPGELRAFLADPGAYVEWFRAGASPEAEHRRIAAHGPFTRLDAGGAAASPCPARTGILGIGWHYPYPGNPYRWANIPDARVAFTGALAARRVRIELDPGMWQVTPVPAFDVFCDGVLVGTCDRSASEFEFVLPRHGGTVEISLRQYGLVRFIDSGMHVNWHRMLAPVRAIELRPG